MSGRPRQFDNEKVIQAAMDAFWQNGFDGTSAQDLVDSTGIGRGSLYAAFGSKEKLYHDALASYHDKSILFHQEVFAAAGSVKERLRTLLQKGVEIDLGNTERNGCMSIFAALERSSRDPVVENLSRRYIKQLEEMFRELFAQGLQRGEFPTAQDPAEMARAFMCSYFGFRTFGRMVHEREYLEPAIKMILDRI